MDAIGQIGGLIHQISGIQGTIAGAVEEQAAATGEISRSAAEAAAGSGEIARNVAGVARAADGTLAGAGEARTAAESLARMATDLHALVRQFRCDGPTARELVTGSRPAEARRVPAAKPNGTPPRQPGGRSQFS